MDKLEKLMNWLSDMDWSWWPFLFLRPRKDEVMTNLIVLKISLCSGTIGGLILGFLMFLLGYNITQIIFAVILVIIFFCIL